MAPVTRSALWLDFFGLILAAWVMMYVMSTGMGLDLLGRPDATGQMMRGMDLRMDMWRWGCFNSPAPRKPATACAILR